VSQKNLIYNCEGDKYWEPVFNLESGRLYLYEGKHGDYIGVIMKYDNINSIEYESYEEFKNDYDNALAGEVSFSQEIINLQDGSYIGEIKNGRLIVNEQKKQMRRVQPNVLHKPLGRIGYACQPKQPKSSVPEGYCDFEVGW